MSKKLTYAELLLWFTGSDHFGPPDEIAGVMQDDRDATTAFAAAVIARHWDGECACMKESDVMPEREYEADNGRPPSEQAAFLAALDKGRQEPAPLIASPLVPFPVLCHNCHEKDLVDFEHSSEGWTITKHHTCRPFDLSRDMLIADIHYWRRQAVEATAALASSTEHCTTVAKILESERDHCHRWHGALPAQPERRPKWDAAKHTPTCASTRGWEWRCDCTMGPYAQYEADALDDRNMIP